MPMTIRARRRENHRPRQPVDPRWSPPSPPSPGSSVVAKPEAGLEGGWWAFIPGSNVVAKAAPPTGRTPVGPAATTGGGGWIGDTSSGEGGAGCGLATWAGQVDAAGRAWGSTTSVPYQVGFASKMAGAATDAMSALVGKPDGTGITAVGATVENGIGVVGEPDGTGITAAGGPVGTTMGTVVATEAT